MKLTDNREVSRNRPQQTNGKDKAVATKTASKATKAPSKGTRPKKIKFNEDFRPGKGIQFSADLFDSMLGPLSDMLVDLEVELDEENGGRGIAGVESRLKRAYGDPIEVDLRYGKKWLVRVVMDGKEEIRACVVVKNDQLKVDLRRWYNPNKD